MCLLSSRWFGWKILIIENKRIISMYLWNERKTELIKFSHCYDWSKFSLYIDDGGMRLLSESVRMANLVRMLLRAFSD